MLAHAAAAGPAAPAAAGSFAGRREAWIRVGGRRPAAGEALRRLGRRAPRRGSKAWALAPCATRTARPPLLTAGFTFDESPPQPQHQQQHVQAFNSGSHDLLPLRVEQALDSPESANRLRVLLARAAGRAEVVGSPAGAGASVAAQWAPEAEAGLSATLCHVGRRPLRPLSLGPMLEQCAAEEVEAEP